MRHGSQAPAASQVRPTKRAEKTQQGLQPQGSQPQGSPPARPPATQAYRRAGRAQRARVSASLHEPRGTSEQTGVSGGSNNASISWEESGRRLTVCGALFLPVWKWFCSVLPLSSPGTLGRRMPYTHRWSGGVSDRFENTFADLNQKTGEIISADRLGNSGHITPPLGPCDPRRVSN